MRRDERFYSQLPSKCVSSHGSALAWCPFLDAWLKSVAGHQALFDFSTALDASIEGIRRESVDELETKFIVEHLTSCKGKSRAETAKTALYLYTRESFLYRLLNTALRDEDLTKVETLGPFCFLLRQYSRSCQEFTGTVYRGANFSSETIETYRKSVNAWRTWPSYTSTTKSRPVAELRGNVLFLIKILPIRITSIARAFDITNISQFPSEEEVLLPAGTSFQVVRVDETSSSKCFIEIKIWLVYRNSRMIVQLIFLDDTNGPVQTGT